MPPTRPQPNSTPQRVTRSGVHGNAGKRGGSMHAPLNAQSIVPAAPHLVAHHHVIGRVAEDFDKRGHRRPGLRDPSGGRCGVRRRCHAGSACCAAQPHKSTSAQSPRPHRSPASAPARTRSRGGTAWCRPCCAALLGQGQGCGTRSAGVQDTQQALPAPCLSMPPAVPPHPRTAFPPRRRPRWTAGRRWSACAARWGATGPAAPASAAPCPA
jgi:hypothetical protein